MSSGLIFALGLGCAGMTDPMKAFKRAHLRKGTWQVMNFLDFAGYWDPSLAFVMGCGICVSGPAFLAAERFKKVTCPLNEMHQAFENPPKKGNYLPLVLGAVFFGLGWGLIGLCPGPALVAIVPKIVTGISKTWEPDFGLAAAALMILERSKVNRRWINIDQMLWILMETAGTSMNIMEFSWFRRCR